MELGLNVFNQKWVLSSSAAVKDQSPCSLAETLSREENGTGYSSTIDSSSGAMAFHPRITLIPDRSQMCRVADVLFINRTLLEVLEKCGRNMCNMEQRLNAKHGQSF